MADAALAADLVLANGRIYTMGPDDRVVSAVAVRGDRVVAVGDDTTVRGVVGPATRVEDLGGAVVVPGLIDAHNHLLSVGQTLGQVQLYGCRSLAEVADAVAARVAATPPGTWIVGRGWDESLLAERRHPTRHDLDAVAPDHPVVLHRVWNQLVANSAALRLAGIGAATPDPPAEVPYAGSFERDAAGEPTGHFRDRAKAMITDAIPPPDEEARVAAIGDACRAYNAVGLTSVGEPGLTPGEVRAFHRAAQRGVLTVRTEAMLAGWGFVPAAEEAGLRDRFDGLGVVGGFGDPTLRLAGVKLMPDGGVGDRTAKMHPDAPYAGEPSNTGTWVVHPDELTAQIAWCHRRGWAVDVHTCGSLAQEVTVRAIAAAIEGDAGTPGPRLPHRIHHAYFPTAEALAVMARHRIPALVSAPFLASLGESFITAVGRERAARAMPARTYRAAGVPLVGTSDAPIADFDPWRGMEALVTRTTVTGRVLGPEEALTPREALRAYTADAAAALGLAAERGTLAPGRIADLAVLDRDPLGVAPDALGQVRPVATMVGGRWVYGG